MVKLERLKSKKLEDEVFIVGGGTSLKHFNFYHLANKDTIVVNSAFLNVPYPNYFITVDYTFLNKRNAETFKGLQAFKIFVADFSYPFLQVRDGQIVDTRYDLVYHLENFDFIVQSYFQEGIGFQWEEFRTGKNSGFCALQLAILLGYKRIYLLGIDLCCQGDTHYHEGYGESQDSFDDKLKHYRSFFELGLLEIQRKREIEVFSCSAISSLNNTIPFRNIERVLR